MDDIVDTAGSVTAAVDELKRHGAGNVTVACAHPVFSGPALARLQSMADRAAAETWHDALDVIQLGEMPPEDEPPMSDRERALLVGWIQGRVDAAIASMKSRIVS